MKYKVKNKLEQAVRYKNIVFGPKETKILDEEPYSDKFIVEKVEEKEQHKPIKSHGGNK